MTQLLAGGMTDAGRVRPDNQDAYGEFAPETRVRDLGALSIVADGVGGHRGGSVASAMAVATIAEMYYSEDLEQTDLLDRLGACFLEANRRLHSRSLMDESLRGMASTCTALVIHAGHAYVAHLGDSRAYLVRSGTIRCLTKDHSLVQCRVDAGLLTPEEARHHAERNVITRSLGFEAETEPDLIVPPISLRPEDHLVLTTDGLHGLVSDEEIAATVESSPPMDACRRLVDAANRRGGHDNITVQILRVVEA